MARATPSSPRLLVGAALTATILLWGAAFAAIREALPSLGYGGLASGRLALAAVAFGLLSLFTGVRRPRRAELPVLAAMGATGYAGYQLLLSAGEQTVPAGTAALLLTIAPVIAAVLAGPVLGERLGARGWAGLVVALGGAVLVALSHRGVHGGGLAGAGLVAAAATVYALWVVLQKLALRSMSPLHATTWATWFGALIALPFGHGLPSSLGHASSSGIVALLVLGIVLSTVPFLLWAWVLARLPASVAASALLMIGPAGVLMGWLLLGEQPALLALVGGAIGLLGVAAVVVRAPLRLPRLRPATVVRAPTPQHA
jgi:drug/metabolite transporter (DMT)-like permease